MRFDRLTLRDFRRFRDYSVEFAPGLTVVVGDNETGKSTLREALTLALFQDAKATKKAVAAHRRWGAAEGFALTMDLTADGQKYRLIRDFETRTNRLELPDGEGTLQDAKAIAQTLRGLIGLGDRSVFESTVRISQRELTAIQSEKSIADSLQATITGGGDDVIASGVIAKLDAKTRELTTNGAVNQGPLVALPNRIAALEETARSRRARLDGASIAARQFVGEREQQAKDQEELARLSELKKTADRCLDLQGRLQVAREAAERLDGQIERASKLASEIAEADAALAAAEPILSLSAAEFAGLESDARTLSRDLAPLERGLAEAEAASAALLTEEETARAADLVAAAEESASADEIEARRVTLAGEAEAAASRAEAASRQAEECSSEIAAAEAAGARDAASDRANISSARARADAAAAAHVAATEAARRAAERSAGARAPRTAPAGASPRPLVLFGVALAILGALVLLAAPALPSLGLLLLASGSGLVVWSLASARTRGRSASGGELDPTTDARLAAEVATAEATRRETELARMAAEGAVTEARRLAAERAATLGEQLATMRAATADHCLNAERAIAERDRLAVEQDRLSRELAAAAERSRERRAANERLAAERRGAAEKTLADATNRAVGARSEAIAARTHLTESLARLGSSTLDDLRARRAEAFALQHRRDGKRAELSGLLGDQTLADVDNARRAASRQARDLTEALEEPEMAHAARDLAAYQSLQQQIAALTGRIGERAARLPGIEAIVIANQGGEAELHAIEEELAELRSELDAARERQSVYTLARDVVEEARAATLVTAQQALENRLGSLAGELTNGRYTRVTVQPTDLALSVSAPGLNRSVPVELGGELSQGTVEQIYLAARLALGELLANGKHPPLILDDPFVSFDETRTTAALDLLKRLSSDWQIILFTKDPAYARIADRAVALPADPARGESAP